MLYVYQHIDNYKFINPKLYIYCLDMTHSKRCFFFPHEFKIPSCFSLLKIIFLQPCLSKMAEQDVPCLYSTLSNNLGAIRRPKHLWRSSGIQVGDYEALAWSPKLRRAVNEKAVSCPGSGLTATGPSYRPRNVSVPMNLATAPFALGPATRTIYQGTQEESHLQMTW